MRPATRRLLGASTPITLSFSLILPPPSSGPDPVSAFPSPVPSTFQALYERVLVILGYHVVMPKRSPAMLAEALSGPQPLTLRVLTMD